MQHEEYIDMGLNGKDPLKVILRGSIETVSDTAVGVVSLVYATMDREVAKAKIYELMEADADAYYMVYSVPLDMDLMSLEHYPSIAITKEDLDT